MNAPLVHLTAAAIDSIGQLISDRNMQLLDGIDQAYNGGKYGAVGSTAAKSAALSAFIYHAMTAFDLVTQLALQKEAIYETSEEDLKEAFTSKYRNPGFYPIVDLLAARTGFGHYCLTFRMDGPPKEITIAGDAMKSWSEESDLFGRRARVLNIDMKTFSYDRVHVVYEEHSDGAIEAFTVNAGEFPVEVVSMEGIRGQFIRKYGFHEVAAIAMWKTKLDGLDPSPLKGAYLGAAIYFPALKVETPWWLPDLGFDDLRKFEYPEPLLRMTAVQEIQKKNYAWAKIKKDLRFAKWEGDGGIPADLKVRYPDK